MAEPKDLADGEVTHVQGSGAKPYELKNVGGVYSCTCPAWRNQSTGLDRRTCKHLKGLRGEAAELQRVGAAVAANPSAGKATAASSKASSAQKKDTAPPVLLAHTWESHVDVSGWWMSEKLDGVRAWWDGKQFLSRLGNTYHAPKWFTEGLPEHPLDGELWVGRKLFQQTISIVRRFDQSEEWRKVSFVVFDAPHLDAPFEERLEFLRARFPKGGHPHCWALEQRRCEGIDDLRAELRRVEALGGEGLMVRRPGSRYVPGRSESLLKIKTFFDAEAKVVGHTAGAGKHKGKVGALEVVLPDGTAFQVGTGLSDAERANPPPVGAIITFRYQELSKDGVPRFPSYVGVRDDVEFPAPQAPQKAS